MGIHASNNQSECQTSETGPSGSVSWGEILGTITNQEDLIAYLEANYGTPSTTPAIQEINFGSSAVALTTTGQATSQANIVSAINQAGFTITAGKIALLNISIIEFINGVETLVQMSYFFTGNNTPGTWGTTSDNGAVTYSQLLVNNRKVLNNNFSPEAGSEFNSLGDIGSSTIEDYLNGLADDAYNLLNDGTIYYFDCIINGESQLYQYVGSLPVDFGQDTSTAPDFDLIASSGTPIYGGGIAYTGFNSEDVGVFYADNYDTLQDAVDAIPSNGGKLILSASDYILTSKLTIDKPIIIEGQGSSDLEMLSHVTTIQTASGTIDMIEFAHENIFMRDLSLVNTHALPTAGSGIYVTSGIVTPDPPEPYPAGFKLNNVSIQGFYDNISIKHSYHWSINLLTSYKAVRYGIYIRNENNPDGGDSTLSNSWIYAGGRNSDAGIRHISGGGLKMVNVKFNSTGGLSGGGEFRLVRCYDSDLGGASGVLNFANCSFENYSLSGVRILDQNHVNISNCQFASYVNTGWGLYLGGVTAASCIGNVMRLRGTSIGVEIFNCDDVTLGNTFFQEGSGLETKVDSTSSNIYNLTAVRHRKETFACSDETSDLAVGKVFTLRVLETYPNCSQFNFSVEDEPTGSTMILDVHKNGTTIYDTKPTIDDGETSTLTAATVQVITGGMVSFAAGDLIEVYIDQVGGTTAGVNLKGQLIYNPLEA